MGTDCGIAIKREDGSVLLEGLDRYYVFSDSIDASTKMVWCDKELFVSFLKSCALKAEDEEADRKDYNMYWIGKAKELVDQEPTTSMFCIVPEHKEVEQVKSQNLHN